MWPHLLTTWTLLHCLGLILCCCALPKNGTNNEPAMEIPATLGILRRNSVARGEPNRSTWAQNQKIALQQKYGLNIRSKVHRRASGTNLLSDQNADSSYFGSIAIGTPPVSYNVILDTGSSDLWLASDAARHLLPKGSATFNPNDSSSYASLGTDFKIQYGSGNAEGVLGRDTVQFAGFEIPAQAFGVVSDVTDTLLDAPVSGLLGLGFQSIATSGVKPFWQTLADTTGALDSPVMAFHLTRFVNDSDTRAVELGGSFSLGAVNSSLYTGEIDYQSIPDGSVGYWVLPMSGIAVNGAALDLASESGSLAAIDTGTTLVGGPSDDIQNLYANVPGSAPGTGSYQDYYTYPCSTNVTVSLRFGNSSKSWPISPADFRLLQVDDDICLGAFFDLSNSSSIQTSNGISWVVGDTFLKNVYSVFRASPPSVGFAQLSDLALSMDGVQHPIPTPTIGATVTVTGSANHGTTLAMPKMSPPSMVAAMLILGTLSWL